VFLIALWTVFLTDSNRVRVSLSMLLQIMDENCTLRPCATDFSIAAIMARHDRRSHKQQDTLLPLGRQHAAQSPRS